MRKALTEGPVIRSMLQFTWPMLLGNLLQQTYNIVDTWVVGRYLGADALAAVGSAFALMTFLNSILMGLCMGASALCAICYGAGNIKAMRERMACAAVWIAAAALLLQLSASVGLRPLLLLMQTPRQLLPLLQSYLEVILLGTFFIFLYNFYAYLLRAIGNTFSPLLFLGVGTAANIVLDLYFVLALRLGIRGAALATILAQLLSALGLMIHALYSEPILRLSSDCFRHTLKLSGEVLSNAAGACLQQSLMNFGILMIQGLVNSFGARVMAAFAVGVKIDAFAYMPVQEFGNAFSVFIAQNHGAGHRERMRRGTRAALCLAVGFGLLSSVLVYRLAPQLVSLFLSDHSKDILDIGVRYLRTEGLFYAGIAVLFLCYAYFRATACPMISVWLTIISLGTRVLISYLLAPHLGYTVIWWAIPIGWFLADLAGGRWYRKTQGAA